MESRTDQLREWFLQEVSRGDPDCDRHLRKFLLQDREVVRKINFLFRENEIYEIKKIITKYLSDNKIIIRTCKACGTKQVIFTDELLKGTCTSCTAPLLNRKQHQENSHDRKQSHDKSKKRSCIYCGQPVASYSNMVCNRCYRENSLTSVRFS